MPSITIRPSLLLSLLGLGKQLVLSETEIIITRRGDILDTIPLKCLTGFLKRKRGLFGTTLLLHIEGEETFVANLRGRDLQTEWKRIEELLTKKLESKIKEVADLFTNMAQNDYLRDSVVESLNRNVASIVDSYRSDQLRWGAAFDTELIEKVDRLAKYSPITQHISEIRNEYEVSVFEKQKEFYDRVESNPLTVEQRLAVIRDNDRNLVLAAAGTGKTSVIVAKALDLIHRGIAKPSEILVLAYNNAAAKELRERLAIRSEASSLELKTQPAIMTFHALGRMILSTGNVSTYLSDFMDDPLKLEMWLSEWLMTILRSEPSAVKTFIDLSIQPVNPFDFKSKAEYERYVRDNEFRTLQGEKVRGYQELLIANWLYLNCVDYVYEPRYVTKQRIEVGFDYQPDFHLTGTKIYIEHFGIDRKGNTRADIDAIAYNQTIQSKRELHKRCGTILLETYHYDWIENQLESRLQALMAEVGIQTRVRPNEEILNTLKDMGVLAAGVQRYLKCLQAIRLERLDHSEIKNRLLDAGISEPEKYAEFLWRIVQAYRDELGKQNTIDFDDMILRANDVLKAGQVVPSWTHILVDEFQDISGSRMALLKALIECGPNSRLTAVGDDWQAIYRFAGGKLELTTQFDKLVGPCTRTSLQKTFRYNSSIADVAGTFVMQNPEQYKKNIVTQQVVSEPQIYLLDSKVENTINLESKTLQVIQTIRENDPDGSIAVLARYRYLLDNAKIEVEGKYPKNVRYWTFHGSKGLEADYCILIGFFQGTTGFPNKNRNEAVVEALLPAFDGYPHSEERRLLYVALTRARRKSYLIADPTAPSEFINELLSPLYKICIGSKTFQDKVRAIYKCPSCTDGFFRAQNGKFGLFYSCSSEGACQIKPRVCGVCNAPSIDGRSESRCNNPDCGDTIKICEKCGRPMKLREGRFGRFWGCSGFGLKEDRCKHTKEYFVV